MATVYLAVQESLDREVCLKCMDSDRDGDADFISRFMNEGRIIASLQHPHIITVHDIGTVNEMVWIAMEYVQGGDLKSRLEHKIEPEFALDLVIKVAKALGYGHQRGIVHRDVKPANILFRVDDTVLLTDFGIAKQVTQDAELTSTGTILGSPYYMSPEQAEGIQVDGRTDIYSLGIILYELLTGERPYIGDAAVKVIMQHIQSPIPHLPKHLSHYQPLIEMMMAKDRDDRVQDTDTLVTEVLKYTGSTLDDSQSSNYQGARTTTAQRPWSSRKRLTTLVICTALLMAAAGVFYAYAVTLQRAVLLRPKPAVQAAAVSTPPAITNSTQTTSSGTVTDSQVIHALETLANNSLRDNRLTKPPADNAYYYFSRLLALDPDNQAVHKGFEDIAERFVVLAEQEFSKRNYDKALSYIALGLEVNADNRGLKDLRSFIQHRENSLLDTFLGLFN